MEASETFVDVESFPFQSEPIFIPVLSFMKEHDGLACSIATAYHFKDREIADLLAELANEGYVQMTPRVDDIGFFSLSLTSKGEALLESFQSKWKSLKDV